MQATSASLDLGTIAGAEALRVAIRTLITAGFVVVPRYPTKAMVDVGRAKRAELEVQAKNTLMFSTKWPDADDLSLATMFEAMVAAAPKFEGV